MAVNVSRSMNTELDEGRSDGSTHKLARNRGGVVDAGTFNARQSLHEDYGYGIRDRFQLEAKKSEYAHGDEALE